VPGFRQLRLILDTGSPANSLSKSVFDVLLAREIIRPTGARLGQRETYLLREASIEGQLLPQIEIYLGNRATLVGVDGILGLTFLRSFRHVALDVPTLQLTLRF
jgi:hypothetical protein